MSGPTELYLPLTFPFPIKVISIDAKPASNIQRGQRLLSYSFVHLAPTAGAQPETRFGTWDSTVEGEIAAWNTKAGDVISARKAKDKPVVLVNEPCTHGIQIGGLCGLCGKDMTDYDYTGFSDASRAVIPMTHSAFGPTVSLEEARKMEKETAQHLLKSHKLSLIVDLDQTIVHATVDPTVGEWITEGEAWEARRAAKAKNNESNDDDDECNPNWEALKDVKKFRLGPESFGPPPRFPKGKAKLLENEGCMYYIKPRPGWKEFFEETASKYEMHVYTMGTRAYAEEVCAAIDPDSKYFGGRILSRDESGSLTQKSLQRLFPCDTSMVVIIDDRADVWEWSPNLIKVIPYDFFVGIGDINSSFLPKLEPLTPTGPPINPQGKFISTAVGQLLNLFVSSAAPSSTPPNAAAAEHALPSETPITTPEDAERAERETNQMLTQNSLALEAQMEERPLAKKQEALVASEDGQATKTETPSPAESTSSETVVDTPPPTEKHVRKALLKNDDFELERLTKLLDEVHKQFYSAYESRPQDDKTRRGRRRESMNVLYDVTRIIPRIRADVFKGVHILFSSVIPLDTKPETTEIWRLAHMFGAKVSTELTSEVTHVVAAKRGTVKVDMARRRGGMKIVWVSWFTDSVALWRHQDETPYLLDEPPVTGPSSSPAMDSIDISSDHDPDGDDWDKDPPSETGGPSLELDTINWDEVNDEVDAAMNESDDDDDARSDRSGLRSEAASDDETGSAISSANGTPKMRRKRLRSVTPSDGGFDGLDKDTLLRSPLAKRKKLAAERSKFSKLKEAITVGDLDEGDNGGGTLDPATPQGMENGDGEDDEESDDEDGLDLGFDDDFLARELDEELG
ncbi:Carboxy-terminal domain (CTD) phosphatase [Pleurotus ostreatus]|uniref:RNA polymerase II subunit A C-terminal domain phosphatase n=1 Tax=Pleurotus ostreatus TaxID=5322 RepID=A0A8H7DTM7_PLEOS|nr:Carboxy-terminal domain (CTD) phosphatase [Pleurotus ostreatus]KAF7436339.1 Carboxy-terminal domain (CTD) phosphatase [Pleurotus ostreatus]